MSVQLALRFDEVPITCVSAISETRRKMDTRRCSYHRRRRVLGTPEQ
jgi:hypothetical protein